MKNWKILFGVAVMLGLSLAIELCVFMYGSSIVLQGNEQSLFEQNCSISSNGYEISGNEYTAVNDDPQIIVEGINSRIEYIAIDFLKAPTSVEVFYATPGEGFAQEKSVTEVPKDNTVLVKIPENLYGALRFDIPGTFAMNQIYVSAEPIVIQTGFINSFSIARVIVLSLFLSAVCLIRWKWYVTPNGGDKLNNSEILYCIVIFLFYTAWAVAKRFNYAPDEAMRYDVTKFLFEHNRLPVGDELLSIWGYSYAHLPTMLCNQLGYIFMKIASLFVQTEEGLLIAARMVSVFSATGAVYFIIKVAKRLFLPQARWILVFIFSLIPQYCFLASYVNNDIVAVLGISMIVYSWVVAIQTDWNIKNSLLLSVGISVCALAYYNSYGWILLSTFIVTFTYFRKHRLDFRGYLRVVFPMVAIVLLLISYNFIRQYVLYEDVLGFRTLEKYGELYAIESLKPSIKLSLYEQGVSLKSMLFDMQWITLTYKSFIGVFGYMNCFCPQFVYSIASWFLAAAVFGIVVRQGRQIICKEEINIDMVAFYAAMAISAVITVGLSIYYSYFTGFQPQGRYCYPAWVALAIFVAKGCETLLNKVRYVDQQYAICGGVCGAIAMCTVFVYQMVYLVD